MRAWLFATGLCVALPVAAAAEDCDARAAAALPYLPPEMAAAEASSSSSLFPTKTTTTARPTLNIFLAAVAASRRVIY